MKHLLLLLVLVIVFCTTAEAGESPWTLRFHGAIVHSSAPREKAVANGVVGSIEVDTSGGYDFGAEYRFSERVGLELSVLFAALAFENKMSVGGTSTWESLEASMVPLTLGVPFHFSAGRGTDISLAPTLSHVSYLNISNSARAGAFESRIDIDADTALGAAFGLDRPFGAGSWAFSFGMRFLKTDAAGTDIDPLIWTVGFAYRF